MKTYGVRMNCGCCDGSVKFKTEEGIKEAFHKMGLTCSGKLVNDEGLEVEGVDSFYGYWEEGKEASRGLDYLAEKALGIKIDE